MNLEKKAKAAPAKDSRKKISARHDSSREVSYETFERFTYF